jgi:hypothetical protein
MQVNICFSEDNGKKIKGHTTVRVEIFVKHTSDRGLATRIYRQHQKPNNKANNAILIDLTTL